jgi:hypothetical protein
MRTNQLSQAPPAIAAALQNHDRRWTQGVLSKLKIAVVMIGAFPDYSVFNWSEFGALMGGKLEAAGLGHLDSEDFLSDGIYTGYFYCPEKRLAEAMQLLSKEVAALGLADKVVLHLPIQTPE